MRRSTISANNVFKERGEDAEREEEEVEVEAEEERRPPPCLRERRGVATEGGDVEAWRLEAAEVEKSPPRVRSARSSRRGEEKGKCSARRSSQRSPIPKADANFSVGMRIFKLVVRNPLPDS